MLNLYLRIRNWLEREEGQDLAEYALLIGLIALVVVASVTLLGGGLNTTFGKIKDAVLAWGVPGS